MNKNKFFLLFLLGSLWGGSEIVLSQIFVHNILQFKGALLTGISIGIIGYALFILKNRIYAFIVLLIVLIMKLLIIPIQHVHVSCIANSLLAVIIDFSTIYILWNFIKSKRTYIFGTGFLAGFSSNIIFYNLGIHLRPCNYLLSFSGLQGFIRFTIFEGLLWGLFSGIMLLISYSLKNYFEKFQIRIIQYSFGTLSIILWIISIYTLYTNI